MAITITHNIHILNSSLPGNWKACEENSSLELTTEIASHHSGSREGRSHVCGIFCLLCQWEDESHKGAAVRIRRYPVKVNSSI